jgi:hypothetical protein
LDLRFLGIEATVARDCCGLVESEFENTTFKILLPLSTSQCRACLDMCGDWVERMYGVSLEKMLKGLVEGASIF